MREEWDTEDSYQNSEQDDGEKTTENENEVTEKPAFDELLEDFNAAFSLTGEDRSGLFTIFLLRSGLVKISQS